MALISCSECGGKVSDKATACPHCGCPVVKNIPKPINGVIRLYWAERKGDSIYKVIAELDGKEVATMKASDVVDVPLPFGQHILRLFIKKHLLIEDLISIAPDYPKCTYAFKQKMGFSHVQLKRVYDEPKTPAVKAKPRCPTCGSENIIRIPIVARAIDVGIFGMASNSINKTFECKDCRYTW